MPFTNQADLNKFLQKLFDLIKNSNSNPKIISKGILVEFKVLKKLIPANLSLSKVINHPFGDKNETFLHILVEDNNAACAMDTNDQDYIKAIKLCLSYGANINALTTEKKTPLHYALRKHDSIDEGDMPAIIDFLLENKADPTVQDQDGRLPLHYAVDLHRYIVKEQEDDLNEIIALLTENNENHQTFFIKDHHNITPRDIQNKWTEHDAPVFSSINLSYS